MKTIHHLAYSFFAQILILSCFCLDFSTERVSAATPVESSSFDQVAEHLDIGGPLYLFLGTEQWLSGLSGKIIEIREWALNLPNMSDGDREQAGRVFNLITSLVKNSGVEDVSGIGISSVVTEKGFYRNKSILHHYPGKNNGYLWSMFGSSPHALTGLDWLPANTALATFGDLNLAMLWQAIEREIDRAGIPELAQGLQEVRSGIEKNMGIKLDQLFNSLGNEYGLTITLNAEHTVALPLPPSGVEIPEPGILLAIKVKDDLIFNWVDQILQSQESLKPQLVNVDKDGLKMRTLAIPLPVQITFRPTVARSGDYLFLATSDVLIQEALAVKSGQKPGLKAQDEYKQLALDLPKQGNQFVYVSKRFEETVAQIQTQAMKANPQIPEPLINAMQKFFGGGSMREFVVAANTAEGWVSTGNGNQDMRTAVVAPLVVFPAGLMAAIAIPNFVKARSAAMRNACIANLKQLDGAKESWALENRKKIGDTCTMKDLVPNYIRSEPRCPAGTGCYILNSIGENPECPNHDPNNSELKFHKL